MRARGILDKITLLILKYNQRILYFQTCTYVSDFYFVLVRNLYLNIELFSFLFFCFTQFFYKCILNFIFIFVDNCLINNKMILENKRKL